MACMMVMPKSATIAGDIGWDKMSTVGPKRGILDDEAYSRFASVRAIFIVK
jgi:hypothetical protein